MSTVELIVLVAAGWCLVAVVFGLVLARVLGGISNAGKRSRTEEREQLARSA